MKTLTQIRKITDQYDACKRECDGMTNILHFFLNEAGIAHKVYQGNIKNRVSGAAFEWHMWIELETKQGRAIIDYRARQWLGTMGNTPHGVFLKHDYPHMLYAGSKMEPHKLPKEYILYLF